MIRRTVKKLADIPNVGSATISDLHLINITEPSQLVSKDPYKMYDDLCRLTTQKHDPCMIDVFIAAVRYMEGSPRRKWWEYTKERKTKMGTLK